MFTSSSWTVWLLSPFAVTALYELTMPEKNGSINSFFETQKTRSAKSTVTVTTVEVTQSLTSPSTVSESSSSSCFSTIVPPSSINSTVVFTSTVPQDATTVTIGPLPTTLAAAVANIIMGSTAQNSLPVVTSAFTLLHEFALAIWYTIVFGSAVLLGSTITIFSVVVLWHTLFWGPLQRLQLDL